MVSRSLSTTCRAENTSAQRARLSLAKMLRSKGFDVESMGSTLEARLRVKRVALSPSSQPLRVWISVRQEREAAVVDAIVYTKSDWTLDPALRALFTRRFLDTMSAVAGELGVAPDGFAHPERYEDLETTDFNTSDHKKWPQIARWLGLDPAGAASDYVGKDVYLVSPDANGPPARHPVFDAVGSPGLVSRLDQDAVATLSTVCALATTDSELPPRLGADLTDFSKRIAASRLFGLTHRLVYVATTSRPLVDFLVRQGRVRQKLPVRYVLRCRDCGHEKITNPEYQKAVAKSSRFRDVTGMASSALLLGPLSPFVIASRLVASNNSPAEACAHCQGTGLDRTLITICPKCQTIVHEPVLRRCPEPDCGQSFLDLDDDADHWRPLNEDWLGSDAPEVPMAVQIGPRTSGVAITKEATGKKPPGTETSLFPSPPTVDRSAEATGGPPDDDRTHTVEALIDAARREVVVTYGSLPTSATFAVPERWNVADRKALRQAAKDRGLSPIRIVDCALASAAAAGSSLANRQPLLSLHFSDEAVHLSVLMVNNTEIELVDSLRDTEAGLNAWRAPIEEWIRESSVPAFGQTLFAPHNAERVRRAAAKALRGLRSATKTTVFVPYVKDTGDPHFEAVLTREDYAQSSSPLHDRLAARISELAGRTNVSLSTFGALTVASEDGLPPNLEAYLTRRFRSARLYADEPALVAAKGALRCSPVKKRSVSISA